MFTTARVLIFFVLARMASNSGVFRFTSVAHYGNYIFHFYSEDQVQCLRACYEERFCAVVQYDENNHNCILYETGSGTVEGYELSRGQTESTWSCRTEEATGDIPFQKIPHAENPAGRNCNDSTTSDAAVIQPYFSHRMYRLYFPNSSKVPNGWETGKPRLLFSKKAEATCVSVPVFHKANHRRLYFGKIYNTTGFYFYNAYAFTDRCVSPEGECLGTQKIQEYVDEYGNIFYDKPGKTGLEDTKLGQTFYILGMEVD